MTMIGNAEPQCPPSQRISRTCSIMQYIRRNPGVSLPIYPLEHYSLCCEERNSGYCAESLKLGVTIILIFCWRSLRGDSSTCPQLLRSVFYRWVMQYQCQFSAGLYHCRRHLRYYPPLLLLTQNHIDSNQFFRCRSHSSGKDITATRQSCVQGRQGRQNSSI